MRLSFADGNPFLRRFVRELEAQSPLPPSGGRVDTSGAPRSDLDAARVTWAARVLDEYRSVVVFSELLGLLARIEAPFHALVAVQRLIGDELRHVQLCAGALAELDPEGKVAIDLADLALPPGDDPDEARAYEIVVRELVVAETESVAMIRAYRDACGDDELRRILSILLRDEVRHAATGRHLMRLLAEVLPPEPLRELGRRLPATVARDLEHIRSVYVSTATDGPGRRFGASIRPDEVPPPAEYGPLEPWFAPGGHAAAR